jgi:hypothetical protein
LLPDDEVGIAIDCTNKPPVVYSSRKTAVELPVRLALPSPTRTTTIFPAVNGDPAEREKKTAMMRKKTHNIFSIIIP